LGVWLASYPRSGNTLLRMLIHQAFGLSTYSLYDDPSDIGADPALSAVVGHVDHGMGEDFVRWAREQPGLVLAKTHDPAPAEPDRAIYVVRDGRASVVSYFHYRQQFAQDETTLGEVVRGEVWGGDWSDHVLSWIDRPAGETLLLRFEDMIARPEEAVGKMGAFLGLKPLHNTSVDFQDLHARFPHFFRSGANDMNVRELSGADLEEFRSMHAPTMQRLGY
jgi:hypothetical protein